MVVEPTAEPQGSGLGYARIIYVSGQCLIMYHGMYVFTPCISKQAGSILVEDS